MSDEQKPAEQIATERNIAVLRLVADAERTIAKNHRKRKAWALAAVHDCAARQLDELLAGLDRTLAEVSG